MNKVILLCTTLLLLSLGKTQAQCDLFPDAISGLAFFCDELYPVCFDLPFNDLSEYEIDVDGIPYGGQLAGCNFDTVYNYSYSLLLGQGNNGPYMLNNWTIDGTDYAFQFSTIDDLVIQMNAIDPTGNWIHLPDMLLIVGGATGSNYSPMSATHIASQTSANLGISSSYIPLGSLLSFEAGTYEIIFTHIATSCPDTLILDIQCFSGTTSETITNTISADENPYVVCIDTTELPGTIVSIENVCPDENQGFVNFLIDEDEYCVKYQGLKCNGMDRACIVVCDEFGLCDTTFFEITVDNTLCDLESERIEEEIFINLNGSFCVDTTEMPGMIVNIQNTCVGTGNVDFNIDATNFCVNYEGEALGKDTACIVLTDQYGNQDTTFFCVNVVSPIPENIIDTIFFSETLEICVETNELAGNNYLFFNDCEENAGEALQVTLNDVTLCAEIEGIGLGQENACIILCDEFGVCDTTNITIFVADNGDPCAQNPPPTAIDDSVETLQNTAINIPILDNDTIPDCSEITLEIIENPASGIVMISADGQSFDYLPGQSFCGDAVLTYQICNDNGCSTATVSIDVNCIGSEEVKVYSGFSPNGDTINDYFKIENIENFPNSELIVFNRWGSKVFNQKGYQNNWNGSYRNTMLPDGTYYYIVKLDEKREMSGYVQLQR